MGLEIGPLGAARVSPTLQPYRKGRLVPDVYLAGDVVQSETAAASGPTMSQLGSTAVRQGRVAGVNAAGGSSVMPAVLGPWISQIGGIQIAGAGLSTGLAEYYGLKTVAGAATGLTRARYFPGGKPLKVRLIAEQASGRLVGAQILAGEDAGGRINWISAAILNKATVAEFLESYENSYCPPTSQVTDVAVHAAEDLASKL